MAREILFKAKRIDNGEWVEGYYVYKKYFRITKEGVPKYEGYKHFIHNDMYGFMLVDESTICQYTGLTDNNGNKIWENDIVKYHFGEEVAPIRFGEYQSCFDSAKTAHIGFYVDWNNNKALRKDLGYWVNMIDCNVIGNIFDNPELLGGADNG